MGSSAQVRGRALAAVVTLYSEEMKNKHSQILEVQAAVVDGGCDVPDSDQWHLNNARLRNEFWRAMQVRPCWAPKARAGTRGVARRAFFFSRCPSRPKGVRIVSVQDRRKRKKEKASKEE